MSIRSPLELTRWLFALAIAGAFFCSLNYAYSQTDQNALQVKTDAQQEALDDEEFYDNPLGTPTRKRPLFLGPCVGYNRSMHSGELSSFASDNQCPKFKNGSGTGFFAGFTVEFQLGNYKASTSSLIFRFLYNSLPASFVVNGGVYPTRMWQNDQWVEIYQNVEHKKEVKYNIFTFEPLYKSNILSKLGVIVGPTFDFAMTSTDQQTMSLVPPTPANATLAIGPGRTADDYSPDRRTLFVKKSSDIDNVSKFRLGIKFGLQYEILMKGYYIVPGIHYNFGVTQLSSRETWRVNALQLGVDIRFPWNILSK